MAFLIVFLGAYGYSEPRRLFRADCGDIVFSLIYIHWTRAIEVESYSLGKTGAGAFNCYSYFSVFPPAWSGDNVRATIVEGHTLIALRYTVVHGRRSNPTHYGAMVILISVMFLKDIKIPPFN